MKEINHLSVHQWIRSSIPDSQQPTSPIGFLFLKLPPPPCAVLLVIIYQEVRIRMVQLIGYSKQFVTAARENKLKGVVAHFLNGRLEAVDLVLNRNRTKSGATALKTLGMFPPKKKQSRASTSIRKTAPTGHSAQLLCRKCLKL